MSQTCKDGCERGLDRQASGTPFPHTCMHTALPDLDGLQGATEEHVVRGDQCAHWVVMGPDCVHLLQVLDVPHLVVGRTGNLMLP